jgi:hypothetical protein
LPLKDDILRAFIEKGNNNGLSSGDVKETKHLESMLVELYDAIISGDINDEFWEKQYRTGLRYIANGIKLDMLLAMISFLQKEFASRIFTELPADKANEIYFAFKTITDLIVAIILSGYMDLYVDAMEKMSGINKNVIERMVSLECKKLLEEEG